ncbi:hypothetical protein mvi_63340 (plasmid) [Methylobacterium indicum]|uniref:Uncharacterized protein n=2 Tax=Methylobacterium indicum TaxID=1775910 RepID=A0A8H9CA27_9HYPH|nr:hypothetical protein mvi_63340 [Methylobacterium indicum]
MNLGLTVFVRKEVQSLFPLPEHKPRSSAMKEWVATVTYDTGIEQTPDEAGREGGSSDTEVEFYLDDPAQLVDILHFGPNKMCIKSMMVRRTDTARFPTVSMLDLHDQLIEDNKKQTAPRRRQEVEEEDQ